MRPLDVVMNYSPGGRYVWRAEVNRRIKELAVGEISVDATSVRLSAWKNGTVLIFR